MKLPKCGECGSRFSWWRTFQDLNFTNYYKKRKIKCEECGTKNIKRSGPILAYNVIILFTISTFLAFSPMEITYSLLIYFSVIALYMASLPFLIGYDPIYLDEPKGYRGTSNGGNQR